MVMDDVADVPRVKPEASNRLQQQIDRLRKRSVKEDQPFARTDKMTGDILVPDIIKVLNNPEWFHAILPRMFANINLLLSQYACYLNIKRGICKGSESEGQ